MSHLSEQPYTDPLFDCFPSKRAALRTVNRAFYDQMSEVDACIRGATLKYGEEKLMRTCQNSHFGKNYEGELTSDFFNGGVEIEDEDQIVSDQPCYQSAITQQQRLFSQIQDIRKILKIKPTPLTNEKAPQYSPINWDVLIRQQPIQHRELISTNFAKDIDGHTPKSKDYIAYTEQSSTRFIPQMQEKKYNQPSQKGKKEGWTSPKEDALRNIETRVMHSPCTAERSRMCKQKTDCQQLLSRLNKEKREREHLLKGISFKLAKS